MSCSVSQIRMIDINLNFCYWYIYIYFFSAEKDMILLRILASTPMNDCEMTCLGLMWWMWRWMWTEHQKMFLQYWQIFLCENWTLRLPMGNVCAWWLSGNCVGVRGVFQWLFMWVYKYSLLAPVSWRILFFMVWFCQQLRYDYLNDTNVLNVSFRNLQFSFSFSCCTHDLNDIICWWTNNHGQNIFFCDWSWAFSWTISCCCFKFQNENCFSGTFDGVYISCLLF